LADYDWVTSRIAVGGAIESLYDVRKIAAADITHVLNVRTNQDEVPWILKVGLQYASNPTKDKDEKSKPPEWFNGSADIIRAALQSPSARILVHCEEGMNRAPSTAYFFFRTIGLKKDICLDLITSARPKTKSGMAWNDDAETALKKLGYK
jgi:hypothetical protein